LNGGNQQTTSTTSVTYTGLTPATAYSITVVATNAGGSSSAGTGSFTTATPPPDGPAALGTNGLSVSFAAHIDGPTWVTNSSPSTNGYNIASVSIATAGSSAGALDTKGHMFYTADVSVASPSWVQIAGRVSYYTMDGARAVAILPPGAVYLCATVGSSCSWVLKTDPSLKLSQAAISGTRVLGLEVDTNAIKQTADITQASPTWVTVANPTSKKLIQVSVSSTKVVGVATDATIWYCADVSTSCSWAEIAAPSGESAVIASVNGDFISLLTSSGKTFYKESGGAWTRNTGAPTLLRAGLSSFTTPVLPSDYFGGLAT
jgi:hypothetical protein